MSKNSKIVISILFVILFCMVSVSLFQTNQTQQGILTLTEKLALSVSEGGESGTITPDSKDSSDSYNSPSYTPIPTFDSSSYSFEPVTEPNVSTEDDTKEETVYWVPNGKVWHTTESCSTLARSSTILSGTIDEAQDAGKTRVCEKCG